MPSSPFNYSLRDHKFEEMLNTVPICRTKALISSRENVGVERARYNPYRYIPMLRSATELIDLSGMFLINPVHDGKEKKKRAWFVSEVCTEQASLLTDY